MRRHASGSLRVARLGCGPAQCRRIFIKIQDTPNAECMKFVVPSTNEFMKEGTREFSGANVAYDSPLAMFIFRMGGVRGVMIGPQFVSVTKEPTVQWEVMTAGVCEAITAFAQSGEQAVLQEGESAVPYPDTHPDPSDSELVQALKELIAGEIRSMVQSDGGDIRLVGFDEDSGAVLVTLQGACASCQSSSNTLRESVQRTLQHWLPEVTTVTRVTQEYADEYAAVGDLAATGRTLQELEEEMAEAMTTSSADDASADKDEGDDDLRWHVRGAGGGEGQAQHQCRTMVLRRTAPGIMASSLLFIASLAHCVVFAQGGGKAKLVAASYPQPARANLSAPCQSGNNTLELQGCTEGATLTLYGAHLHTAAVQVVGQSPDAPDVDCVAEDPQPLPNAFRCTLAEFSLAEQATYAVQLTADGRAVGAVALVLYPAAKLTRVKHDAQRCFNVSGTGFGCTADALLTFKGVGFTSGTSVSLLDENVDPKCPPPSGTCVVGRRTSVHLACRVQYAAEKAGSCLPDRIPIVRPVLNTAHHSLPAPKVFHQFAEPRIEELTYEKGCESGNGTLHLKQCRNGTLVTLSGAFLDLHSLRPSSGGDDDDAAAPRTALFVSGSGGTSACLRVSGDATTLRCLFVTQSRYATGAFSMVAVTLAGESNGAVVSLAPQPVVHNVTFAEGCAQGNATLSVGSCSNLTVLTISGSGMTCEVDPFARQRRPMNVFFEPAGGRDGNDTVPASCECSLLDASVINRVEDTCGLSCALSCPASVAQRTLSLVVEVGGIRSHENVTVGFVGPPVLDKVVACGATTEVVKALEQPNRAKEVEDLIWGFCRPRDTLTLHGSHFLANATEVVLIPLMREGKVPERVLRPLVAEAESDVVQFPRFCNVDWEVSNATQITCSLKYDDLAAEGANLHAVVVRHAGGTTLSAASSGSRRSYSGRTFLELRDSDGLMPTTVPLDIVWLTPNPHITSLHGCSKQTSQTIQTDCLVKDGLLLSIGGGGFAPDLNNTSIDFVPSEGNDATSVALPPRCLITTNTPALLTCVMSVTSEQTGKHDLRVTTTAGNFTLPVAVNVAPKLQITKLSGCTTVHGFIAPSNATRTERLMALGEQLFASLKAPFAANKSGDAAVAAAAAAAEKEASEERVQIICKNDDKLIVHGAGFDSEMGISVTIQNRTGKNALKESQTGVSVLNRNAVSIEMRHEQVHGQDFALHVRTYGGEVTYNASIELVPWPVINRVVNVDCLSNYGALSEKQLEKRRRLEKRHSAGTKDKHVDPITGELPFSCVQGSVIELHGENLFQVENPVYFAPHNSPDEVWTKEDAAPCEVRNSTPTHLRCAFDHTTQGGRFFPVVRAMGGEGRLHERNGEKFEGVRLIPRPLISSLMFGKGTNCMEGNQTKALQGCKSGTMVTITGKNFDYEPSVVIKQGKGARNGPPECTLLFHLPERLICKLEHTSAAGDFSLSVKHRFGESASVLISVIPGNLYLLFKNTKLVLAVSNIVGWVCAVLWTSSLSTLAWSVEKVQSTAGITTDMVLYNIVGLTGWNIFSIYYYMNSDLGVPVFIQDIAYASSCYCVVWWFVWQLRRFGGQSPTTFAKVYCAVLIAWVAKIAVTTKLSEPGMPELVSAVGKMHLATAVVKYMPQVKYNYVRKSTEGYSIVAVWLDFGGAVLLLLQMFFDGIIRHKWSLMITLNVPKFALCVEVILFNLIYMGQHYVLYRGRRPVPEPRAVASPDESKVSPKPSSAFLETEAICLVGEKPSLVKRPAEPGEG